MHQFNKFYGFSYQLYILIVTFVLIVNNFKQPLKLSINVLITKQNKYDSYLFIEIKIF